MMRKLRFKFKDFKPRTKNHIRHNIRIMSSFAILNEKELTEKHSNYELNKARFGLQHQQTKQSTKELCELYKSFLKLKKDDDFDVIVNNYTSVISSTTTKDKENDCLKDLFHSVSSVFKDNNELELYKLFDSKANDFLISDVNSVTSVNEAINDLSLNSHKYKIGDQVEARASNCDELFYGAKITGIDADGEYSVLYDDSTTEDGLFESSIIPYGRELLFEDEMIRVLNGHMHIKNQIRKARLMCFQESKHLYQTAILLDENDSTKLDYSILAFDVNQALGLTIPMLLAHRGEKRHKDTELQVAILGAGGGAVPMSLATTYQQIKIDVVELSQAVLKAAQEYFGLKSNDPRINNIVMDGLDYIQQLANNADKNTDLLIIDVASKEAGLSQKGIELPPVSFVSDEFISKYLVKSVKNDGMIVINVIAELDCLKLLSERFHKHFHSVYIIATDPNYVFVVTLDSSADGDSKITPELISLVASKLDGAIKLSFSVYKDVVGTSSHMNVGVLLGLYDYDSFKKMLNRPNILV